MLAKPPHGYSDTASSSHRSIRTPAMERDSHPDFEVIRRVFPEIGAVETLNLLEEVSSIPIGRRVITHAAAVRDPTIRDGAVAAENLEPLLHMAIPTIRFLDGLGQAWIGHPVEDMPNALGVMCPQNINNLLVELGDSPLGSAISFYRTSTISAAVRFCLLLSGRLSYGADGFAAKQTITS